MADITDIKEFWETFCDQDVFVSVECEYGFSSSVARDVLDQYGIPCISTLGGRLEGIDLKRMDAMTAINLSLLESAGTDGTLLEPMVNEDGEVDFIEIESFDGNISDQYYTVQTMTYKEECTGVMVTGKKPLPVRHQADWKSIWGDTKIVIETQNMMNNCMKNSFSQHATIVFNDPHLDSAWEDNIDNLHEVLSPFDQIMGYAIYKHIPRDLVTEETKINYNSETSIPIKVSSVTDGNLTVGTLIRRPSIPETELTGNNADCWTGRGETVDFSQGIQIPIDNSLRFETIRGQKRDKLTNVSSIYFLGILVDRFVGQPLDDSSSIEEANGNNTQIWAGITDTTTTIQRLVEGEHYVISYEQDGDYKIPYVVFSRNTRQPGSYGDDTKFKAIPGCAYYENLANPRDEQTAVFVPLSDNNGFLVHEIWAVVNLETPSISVYDPDGENDRALQIAEQLDYQVTPLIVTREPSPIAFNGVVLDQESAQMDHDPTTAQDFENTDIELAMDQMQGSGLTLSLPFLDENGVVELSKVLYDHMNAGEGIQTVYVCGPECEPRLGGRGPSGGVVNEITYSYTDSSSYTISVTEGERLVGGLAQFDGGPYIKRTQTDSSVNGTIIQDYGNHVHYKVRMDDFGERVAINCQHQILRVGDKVSCSIHNAPVET